MNKPTPNSTNEKIGQILLKHTSLTESQLQEALQIQRDEGGLLGEVLVKKNMIRPHEIMRALCIQLGLGFIDDIKANEIEPELIKNLIL